MTISSFFARILDLIFPMECVGCNRHGYALCNSCIATIPSAQDINISETFALFPYKNPTIKRAIWSLKYRHGRAVALVFANLLYDKLIKEKLIDFDQITDENSTVVVPIPILKKTKRTRGFNQSELLAKLLSSRNKVFIFEKNLLGRAGGERQTGLKREERLANISGAFYITDLESVKFKNILLVDDVLTTGATIKEAMRVLYEAGAKKVSAVVVAH